MSRPLSDLLTVLSRSLSWALHPLVLPLYLAALLFSMTAFALFPWRLQLYLGGAVLLGGTVLPAAAVVVLRLRGRLKDLRLTDRRDRILPLAIGTLCYLLAALAVARVGQALFLRKFMLAAACCEAMCCLVSMRWRISLHLTGMGSVVALLVVLNVLGLPALFRPLLLAVVASGLLASARLTLGRHDLRQLAAGFCGGFALTLAALLFL